MLHKTLFLTAFLILLLGFFSTHDTLTGAVVLSSPVDLRYDLTGDGAVDMADVREVMLYASYAGGATEKRERADVTDDGVVDQNDVDFLQNLLH